MRGISGGKYLPYGSLHSSRHIECGSGKTGGGVTAFYADWIICRNVGGRENAGESCEKSSDCHADFIRDFFDNKKCDVTRIYGSYSLNCVIGIAYNAIINIREEGPTNGTDKIQNFKPGCH